MSNHKLITESWRDFFRAQTRRGPNSSNLTQDSSHDTFAQKYEYFYYKEPYFYDNENHRAHKLASTDDLVKIIVDHPVAEHFLVRPNTLGHQGEFYSWKKFKDLNSKVEEIIREKEEAKRKEQERRTAMVRKAISQVSTDSELALAILNENNLDTLVLYHPIAIERDGLPRVIGMISLGETTGPCIPNTLQVRYAAVARKFQKSGFGTILYRLAAAHAKKTENNGGITSDHEGSTSSDARRRWSAIDKDPDFHKRTTSAGNDTFDYDGKKTPDDIEDNCDDSTGNPAAPHSYGVNDKVVQVYEDLRVADTIHNDGDLLYDGYKLYYKAFNVFNRSYRAGRN
tara:strand:+ start:1021 stop:2043 length:1023 start_codon:yes stop_codon:yes gene_type:complete